MIPFPSTRLMPNLFQRGLRVTSLLSALCAIASAFPAHAQAPVARPSPFGAITGEAWACIIVGSLAAFALSLLLSGVWERQAPRGLNARIQGLILQIALFKHRQVHAKNISRVETLLKVAEAAKECIASRQLMEASRQIDVIEKEFLDMSAKMKDQKLHCQELTDDLKSYIKRKNYGASTEVEIQNFAGNATEIIKKIEDCLDQEMVDQANIYFDELMLKVPGIDPSYKTRHSEYNIEAVEVLDSRWKRQLTLLEGSSPVHASWIINGMPESPTDEVRYERVFPKNGVYHVQAALKDHQSDVVANRHIRIFNPQPFVQKAFVLGAEVIMYAFLSLCVSFILNLIFYLDHPNFSVHTLILTLFLVMGACLATHGILHFHRRIIVLP